MTHTTHVPHAHPHVAAEAADYIVVVSNDDDYHAGYHHFSEKINRKLKAGYQLHGPPISMNRILCQAMVRPGGPAHSGDSTLFFKHHVSRHD
jgi:hypothetical protein